MPESEKTMTGSESSGVCEVCERESRHMSRWLDPDGSVHLVCWSCLQRREKRVNVSQRWKRGSRVAAG
jgi:ribosome-binding protein aMBF1 (putative translation factor)